jgi:hypothetical protein
METVVCIVPVSPVRKESAHRSEMTSQLLFGEVAEVLEITKDFTRLRCLHDDYEGWCQSAQLVTITGPIASWDKQLSAEWMSTIELNGYPMHLSLGSSLSMLHKGNAQLGKYAITYQGKTCDPSTNIFEPAAIGKLAMQYLNTPYLWGGRSVFGIDCSGFVQQLFRFFDKPLPRDAYQQATAGEVVGFLQEVQCGDLAFFDNAEGRIIHVGLLFNPDTIIHSSGKVRIDKIDNMGIVNSDTGERTHTLRIIKRYV